MDDIWNFMLKRIQTPNQPSALWSQFYVSLSISDKYFDKFVALSSKVNRTTEKTIKTRIKNTIKSQFKELCLMVNPALFSPSLSLNSWYTHSVDLIFTLKKFQIEVSCILGGMQLVCQRFPHLISLAKKPPKTSTNSNSTKNKFRRLSLSSTFSISSLSSLSECGTDSTVSVDRAHHTFEHKRSSPASRCQYHQQFQAAFSYKSLLSSFFVLTL